MTFDCVVVGLGGFGSSALAALAKRGKRVLGIDRFPPAHRFGSSHGRTRIIRQAYFEHPDYVPLLKRAYDLWRELECETEERLYRECGLFLCGSETGEAVPGALHAAQLHGLQVEQISYTQAAERFPCFVPPADQTLLFEPHAGYLRVEECVLAQLLVAERAGAFTMFGKQVRKWSVVGSGVQIETANEVIDAERLIIAGGAWASQLLPQVLPPLRVLRKMQLWCGIDPGWSKQLQQQPAFYYELGDQAFYGFPSQDGATIKLAEHTGGEEITDPLQVDLSCRESDRAPIRDFVTRYLRGVLPRIADHAACMYTMSPDGHFVIDRHPLSPQVVLAAGFSGHGFKFTSVIGEALADLALEGKTSLPIGFLGLSRFRDSANR